MYVTLLPHLANHSPVEQTLELHGQEHLHCIYPISNYPSCSYFHMEKHVYSILAIKNTMRKNRKNPKTPPKPTVKIEHPNKIERQDPGCPAYTTGVVAR